MARDYQQERVNTIQSIPSNSKRAFRPNAKKCGINKHEANKRWRFIEQGAYKLRVCIHATNRKDLFLSNRAIPVHIQHGTSICIHFICTLCQCHFSGTYQKSVIGRNYPIIHEDSNVVKGKETQATGTLVGQWNPQRNQAIQPKITNPVSARTPPHTQEECGITSNTNVEESLHFRHGEHRQVFPHKTVGQVNQAGNYDTEYSSNLETRLPNISVFWYLWRIWL